MAKGTMPAGLAKYLANKKGKPVAAAKKMATPMAAKKAKKY